jgi:hypothetical protein
MTAEVLSALAIVALLTVVLASAVGRERAAANHLADSRAAARLAERAALALQLHQPLDRSAGTVQIVPLVGADAASAPAGFTWANLRATANGQSAQLTALLPAPAIPADSLGTP